MGNTEQAPAGRREWLGLAVLVLPTLLVAMDMTALFLALPRISTDLHASGTEQLWITDSYGFLVAGFVITMGTLGDRIGRRRLLLVGGGGVRGRVGRRRLVGEPADADRRARAAGNRGRDPGALDAGADHHHVPRRQAARPGHRDLGHLPVHGRRARPGPRRVPAHALLVGLRVPARGARDGAAAGRRARRAARVPRPGARPAGPRERRAVPGGRAAAGLRVQAAHRRRLARPAARGGDRGRRPHRRGVRPAPAHTRHPAAGPAAVPQPPVHRRPGRPGVRGHRDGRTGLAVTQYLQSVLGYSPLDSAILFAPMGLGVAVAR